MIAALLDTSSLLALVRYYLPFDNSGKIKQIIQNSYESGELIIIDKVLTESKYASQGIILKELNFINPKSRLIIKTTDLIPGTKFYNNLENSFCNKDILRLKGITATEFEIEKTRYLASADANLILYAQSIKEKNPVIVTEESKSANDGKIFRKIPDNCAAINMNCCNLPIFLKEHLKVFIQF